jgi:RNA polymerase sigma-70 factor (ECF subfamily)
MVDPAPDTTAALLQRARSGDESARERLIERHLPRLRSWAHRRLPAGARSLADTDDLVQVTFLRALKHLETFEPRSEGAFLAYLRQILLNAMRDEIRRAGRRGGVHAEIDEDLPDRGPSPLETAIGRDALDRYDAAFAKLGPEPQEAVFMRVEMGLTYEQIAEALGKSSPDAARMLITRSLARLAVLMEEP